MEIKDQVGLKVRRWREAQRLTQAEMGRLLGVSGPAIYSVEAGRCLSVWMLVRLARRMGCTTDELLRDDSGHSA